MRSSDTAAATYSFGTLRSPTPITCGQPLTVGRPASRDQLSDRFHFSRRSHDAVSTCTYRDVIQPAHEEPRHWHDVIRDVVYQLTLQRGHRGYIFKGDVCDVTVSKALSTLSQKSATVAESETTATVAEFGDSRTFLRQSLFSATNCRTFLQQCGQALKPCPQCRRKVRLSQKTARQRRQSPNSATVALFCDSVDRV